MTPSTNLHRISLSARTNTVGRSHQADLLIGFLIDNQFKLRSAALTTGSAC